MARWFEDLDPGTTIELGSYTVDRAEILQFARRFDPQPLHIDEEAAARGPFGGLIASGWHTAAIFTRLSVEALRDLDGRGSPGIENLRWRHPVRPGDTLTGTVKVVDAYVSDRDPGRGTLIIEGELRNQDDVVVMTLRTRRFVGRRPPAVSPAAD